jgi:hypothetical protein
VIVESTIYKFGDKVIIRNGSSLDGVVSPIETVHISVLLGKEVVWDVHIETLKL